MIELRNRDMGKIIDIIEYANACLDMDAMRKPIIETISKLIHAEGAMFLLGDSKLLDVDGSNAISIGFKVDPQENLPEYRLLNPFYMYNNPDKYVTTIDELVPYSEWGNHPFYELFCRKLGIYHKLVLYLKKGQRNYGVMCFSRSKKRLNFSYEEKLICDTLARLVTKALSNIRLLSEVFPYANLTQKKNELSSVGGVLLIDRRLNVIDFNSKAQEYCQLLSQNHPYYCREENGDIQIPAEILQDCTVLKELFKKGRQLMPVSLQKYAFLNRIGWIHMEYQLIWQFIDHTYVPYILVSLINLLEEYNIVKEAIKTKYQLTEREMDIIECVHRGLSNNEISQKLFISQDTVETHLKHIFKKAGVKNRTRLANLIRVI